MGRIVVISNPLSHRNRGWKGRLERLLARYPDIVFRELADIADIPRIFVEIEALNPDLVVVNGGDGTVIAIATHIIANDLSARVPPLAVLPGGQTNMIAANLGTNGKPERIIARLHNLVQTGMLDRHVAPQPFLRLEHRASEPIYGTFFGAAAIVRAILFCRRRIFPLGLPNPLAHSLAGLALLAIGLWPGQARRALFPAEAVSIKLDGTPVGPERLLVLLATTLDNLLLGLSPPRRAGDGPVRLVAVAHAAKAVLGALWTLIVRRGRGRPVPGLMMDTGRRLEIELDCPYTLDGELFAPEGRETIRLSGGASLSFVKF